MAPAILGWLLRGRRARLCLAVVIILLLWASLTLLLSRLHYSGHAEPVYFEPSDDEAATPTVDIYPYHMTKGDFSRELPPSNEDIRFPSKKLSSKILRSDWLRENSKPENNVNKINRVDEGKRLKEAVEMDALLANMDRSKGVAGRISNDEHFPQKGLKPSTSNNQKVEPLNRAHNQQVMESLSTTDSDLCYNVHIFYYPWYGNPAKDKKYMHWNHVFLPHWNPEIRKMYETGAHSPPDDIGSNFYPELGPYSSKDPVVIRKHMLQLVEARIGVIAVSYYPPGHGDDNGDDWQDIFPDLLRIANEHRIKVAFHIEPYKNRDDVSLKKDLIHIIETYSQYPAFYKVDRNGVSVPLVYVYDSYLTEPQHWARLLKPDGVNTVRNTKYDAVVIGLVVEEKHTRHMVEGGFDGFYTYFASNGFTYGSTRSAWKRLKSFSEENNLLFIPSVGPGYIDTQVRPWNGENTRQRVNGKYYERSWSDALDVKPKYISITSFNEWHEGTQIERAVPKRTKGFKYLDYLPNKKDFYLQLTRKFVNLFLKS